MVVQFAAVGGDRAAVCGGRGRGKKMGGGAREEEGEEHGAHEREEHGAHEQEESEGNSPRWKIDGGAIGKPRQHDGESRWRGVVVDATAAALWRGEARLSGGGEDRVVRGCSIHEESRRGLQGRKWR